MICPACANRDCDDYPCSDRETCECPSGHSRVARLERELTALKERFERFLETHELWDGS